MHPVMLAVAIVLVAVAGFAWYLGILELPHGALVTWLVGLAFFAHGIDQVCRRRADLADARRTHFDLFEKSLSPGLIVHAEPCGVFGRIEQLNARAIEDFGVQDGDLETLRITDILENMDAERQSKLVKAVAERGEVSMEAMMRTRDAGVVPVLARFTRFEYVLNGTLLVLLEDLDRRVAAREAIERRSRQLELLSSVTRRMTQHLDEHLVLRELVHSAAEVLDGVGAVAGLLEDGELVLTEAFGPEGRNMIWVPIPRDNRALCCLLDDNQPYLTNDAPNNEFIASEFLNAFSCTSLVAVPILNTEGTPVGGVAVYDARDGRPFDDQDAMTLLGVAVSAGIAIENARVVQQLVETREALLVHREELSRLAGELSTTEERERRRLAVELHDGIGQHLAMVRMKLHQARSGRSLTPEALLQCSELLDTAIAETRSLTFQLSPPVLYELGLGPALDWLCEKYSDDNGVECVYAEQGEQVDLEADVRALLYICTRELLINAIKHAEATTVHVTLFRTDDDIVIEVRDDGKGINLARRNAPHAGYGVFAVRERLRALGGTLALDSEPGRGTRAVVIVPRDLGKHWPLDAA